MMMEILIFGKHGCSLSHFYTLYTPVKSSLKSRKNAFFDFKKLLENLGFPGKFFLK